VAQPRSKRGGGYALGLVPVGVALVFGTLCLPRVAPVEDVPLPVPDGRELARVRAADRALALVPAPLPDDVRALGSAIRDFNVREGKQGVDPLVTPDTMNDARRALDGALAPLTGRSDDQLLALRATQLEGFVAEVRAFERTGIESAELEALGGPFVHRMRDVGWCQGHTCSFDDDALRVMFKLAWNGLLRLERPPFTLTRDEERALYAFYLRHPHAAESTRKRIDQARNAARTERSCASLDEAERVAAELWRLEKVRHLAQIDPDYPAEYALGIVRYRHKEFGAAAASFRDWLEAHPDGQWTLRARNYLRASLAMTGLE
jgi:hypothetical protein